MKAELEAWFDENPSERADFERVLVAFRESHVRRNNEWKFAMLCLGRNPFPGESAIYRLLDPETRAVRYTGATKQKLRKRLRSHLKDPRSVRLREWISSLSSPPILEVIIYVPEEQALVLEALAIQAGVDAGLDLLNVAYGIKRTGTGASISNARRWNSKLDCEKAETIRSRYVEGGVSMYALADEFGVSRTAIRQVIANATWREK